MTAQPVTADMVKKLRERTGVAMGKCKEALDQAGGDIEKAIDVLRKAGMASAVKKEGRETKEGIIAYAENSDAVALIEVNAETDFVVQNEKFKQFAQGVAKQAAATKPSSIEDFLSHMSHEDKTLTIDQHRALIVQSLGENIQLKRMVVMAKGKGKSFGIYSHMGGKIVTLVEIDGTDGLDVFCREIAMHIVAESPDYLDAHEVPIDVKAREEEIASEQVKGKPEQIKAKIVEGKLNAFYDQVCLLRQKFVKDPSITIAALIEKESKQIGHPLTLKRFIRWKVGG